MNGPKLQCDRDSSWLDIGLDVGSDGGTLFTTGNGASTYTLEIGDPDKDVERVAFSGLGSSFQADHGSRGRQIIWSGTLRVSTEALASILTQRDTFRMESGTFTFTSDLDISYASCVIERFAIGPKRMIISSILDWIAAYQIILTQLEVG